MIFSKAACATLWLFTSTSDAFTTTTSPTKSSGQRHSSQHLSQLPMLLKREKFDAILTTNRNKDLGYNEPGGRFFEVQSRKDDAASATLVDSMEAAVDLDENDAEGVAEDSAADGESEYENVPPMPDVGFVGMNVTGEIN
eukprot:CAMPEP_0172558184 /NCGR_PEP_ID=MMETSP1067-20121228/77726_1 /TAXON_ID=265564 ORGANISM="Thalassiosira punctigera, Strain Tpunct2005C2" /NCGR_SAMPLE_ID=MMETSP1067 /ASSEMBLY_ACC=CAM_ASM_000444 /LENGTH=139 /DNA_ID=CAMNT_0013347485 /DNA_START=161 /DNA_END=577 /DNA_ORIENTATION=-